MTPTQRTLKAQRELGRLTAIVEKFNRFAGAHGIRQDLFGIIDVIALDPEDGIVGVQSTGQDFSGHYKKMTIERNQECVEWLKAGGRLELWGWRKIKVKRGGKAERWEPRVHVFKLEDFEI